MNRPLRLIAVLAALLLPQMAWADIPLPPPPPSNLPAAVVEGLQPRYEALTRQHDQLDRDIDAQNGQCSDVAADDTARVSACQDSQQRILGELADYKAALQQYKNALKYIPPHGPAAQPRIGAGADVHDAFVVDDHGRRTPLHSGDPVLLNAHVETGPNGRLQILLLDQTVFALGANSDMVLDDFVYDPADAAGTITARLLKGIFRFVSGQVSRTKEQVRVASGSLGHRGTRYEAALLANGSLRLKVFEGEAYFRPNSGGPEIVVHSGQMVLIDPAGHGGPLQKLH